MESWDRPAWWTPPGAPHRLEALIGTPVEPGHLRIEHWFAGQARPDNPWLRGDVVSTQALGPAALSQRGRAGTATHELLAHVPEPDGVVAYAWAVNDPTPRRWRRLGIVTQLPSEPARPLWDGPEGPAEWGAGRVVATATAATRLRSGWVQALVQVDDSIYHLHRQQRGGKVRWLRHACLRLADPAPFAIASEPSMKVAQVSGETDSQPERPRRTLSSSESRSGVRGTDLGVRIDHAGQAFMLFGDTHWTRRRLGTRDSIAAVHQPDADLPSVTFHGSPTAITGGGTTLREYDVPLDAFSLDGELYAFFTSNHFRDAQVMGRSVLTRAPRPVIEPTARWRPLRFAYRGTFSTHRFVNVSVQRWGDHLYLWGTGAYRADDVRLARVDLTTPGWPAACAAARAPCCARPSGTGWRHTPPSSRRTPGSPHPTHPSDRRTPRSPNRTSGSCRPTDRTTSSGHPTNRTPAPCSRPEPWASCRCAGCTIWAGSRCSP
ncbi:MAG: hypothetical protein R2742_05355 [Micropruina glycogenica]